MKKLKIFLNAPDDAINFGDISKQKFNDNSFIYWGDEKVGKLKKGSKIYLSYCRSIKFRIY